MKIMEEVFSVLNIFLVFFSAEANCCRTGWANQKIERRWCL